MWYLELARDKGPLRVSERKNDSGFHHVSFLNTKSLRFLRQEGEQQMWNNKPTNQPTNQGACFKQRIRKRIHSDHQMIIFSSMEIKSVSWRESSDRFERHKQIQ